MKNKIIELRKKGLTINQIVEKLGCAKSTVSYHINKIGLGGMKPKFLEDVSFDTIELIKKYRSELKSYEDILNLVDISEDKLKKICRLSKSNSPTNHFKSKVLDSEKVINYYLSVNSLRKTAKHFQVSRETVRKFIPDELVEKNKLREVKITRTQSVVDWRKRVKRKLIEYKGGKCEICGYNKCDRSLQFHHLNPNEKDFNIAGRSYSYEKLKNEVDKCILVCSNCHCEIHDGITKI